MIAAEWVRLIVPFPKDDCGTTCLFAIAYEETLVFGQIGDGLSAFYDADKSNCTVLEDIQEKDFLNVVDGVLGSEKFNWHWHRIKLSDKCALLLCTDGISSDIADGAIKGFVQGLYSQALNNSPDDCRIDAEHWLTDWPVEGHRDDKTLAFLYRVGYGA